MIENTIAYQVIRSSRKTVSIQISADGKVLVRCPKRMPSSDIHRFVEEKSSWIEKHLAKRVSSPALPPLTQEELHALANQAAAVIPKRTAHFASIIGVDYGRITIRRQRSRWGSCSTKGNLSFNCLLMLTPPEVLDYVVVHELCHRKEMNHSFKFWSEVEAVLPDYRQRRDWLKKYENQLIGRIPH